MGKYAIKQFLNDFFRFIKKHWRNYQLNRAMEERIRQHYRATEREGRAFGYGAEVGRMQAWERNRQQRHIDRAWQDTDRNVTRVLNTDYGFLNLNRKRKGKR